MNQPEQKGSGLFLGVAVSLAALSVSGWLLTRGERSQDTPAPPPAPEPTGEVSQEQNVGSLARVAFPSRSRLERHDSHQIEPKTLQAIPYLGGEKSNGIDTNALIALNLHADAVRFLVHAGDTYNTILALKGDFDSAAITEKLSASVAMRSAVTNLLGQMTEFERSWASDSTTHTGLGPIDLQFLRHDISTSAKLFEMSQRSLKNIVETFYSSAQDGSMTEEVHANMFEAQQVTIDQQRSQADTALRKIERLMNTFIVFPSMAAGGDTTGTRP